MRSQVIALKAFRASVSRWLLRKWEHHLPELLHRILLQILCTETAKALEVHGENLLFTPSAKGLLMYIRFTKDSMDSKSREEQIRCRRRLYRIAFLLGCRIRAITGFTEQKDLKRLIIFLYKCIGIACTFPSTEELTITSCIFCKSYSPKHCQFMGYMDSGLISGIYGCQKVTFTERLTEQCPACKAKLIRGSRFNI